MNKDKITAIWEEDGDLMHLKEFFNYIHQNDTLKERVKQKTMEKIQNVDNCENTTRNFVTDTSIILSSRSSKKHVIEFFTKIKDKAFNKNVMKVFSAAALVVLAVYMGSKGFLSEFDSLQKQDSSNLAESIAQTENVPFESTGIEDFEGSNISPVETFESSAEGLLKNKSEVDNKVENRFPIEIDESTDSLESKIIYILEATLKTDEVNVTVSALEDKVETIGGYISEARQNNIDGQSNAYLVIKVPIAEFDNFKNSLSEFGTISEQNLYTDDITLEYLDVETRLRSWEAQEKRYLEILEQANTVEDILKIENSLANVRREIESLKGQIRYWDNRIDYSEINLDIISRQNNLKIDEPWQPISFQSTITAVKNAVIKSISFIWNSLNYIIVFLGYIFPIAVLLTVAWLVYKYKEKIRRKKV